MNRGAAACVAAGRWPAAQPFVVVALIAIVAGGLVAAATAHAPSRIVIWMVAYLVLVAGVAQLLLGVGQALLAADVPSRTWVALEFVLFNTGNAGVIAGALTDRFAIVAGGEILFAIALGLFLFGTRAATRRPALTAYHGLIGVLLVGAVVGLVLTARI